MEINWDVFGPLAGMVFLWGLFWSAPVFVAGIVFSSLIRSLCNYLDAAAEEKRRSHLTSGGAGTRSTVKRDEDEMRYGPKNTPTIR